ncbi:MAG: hypothetical protein KIH89_001225 [Candidatus Shapirobacteria bacterium]|nr:hypothetical protein [Candidatus Shapirobacteria bacterium]
MSLGKNFFHQATEIPLVSVSLVIILSPLVFVIWLLGIIQEKKIHQELIDLKSLINDIIPKPNQIIDQIKKIEDPKIPVKEKHQILKYLISIFEKCHAENRAAKEIIKHLRQIDNLLVE